MGGTGHRTPVPPKVISNGVIVLNVVRKVAIGIISTFIIIGITATDAHTISPILPIPNSEFKEILPSNSPVPEIIIETRHDFPTFSPKPKVQLPPNPPRIVPVPTKQSKPKLTGNFTSGVASYYCLHGFSRCTIGHSGGMYAAIRKDLLFLRGKTIRVCAKNCIYVRIIDCNCGPHANLIDLYSDAFKKLAPLSRGIVGVTLKW